MKLNEIKDNEGALKSRKLRWVGTNVTSAAGGQLVLMYAPKKYEPGSSGSHFDVSNFPDLLMEPFYTNATADVDLTREALQDTGWTFNP